MGHNISKKYWSKGGLFPDCFKAEKPYKEGPDLGFPRPDFSVRWNVDPAS